MNTAKSQSYKPMKSNSTLLEKAIAFGCVLVALAMLVGCFWFVGGWVLYALKWLVVFLVVHWWQTLIVIAVMSILGYLDNFMEIRRKQAGLPPKSDDE